MASSHKSEVRTECGVSSLTNVLNKDETPNGDYFSFLCPEVHKLLERVNVGTCFQANWMNWQAHYAIFAIYILYIYIRTKWYQDSAVCFEKINWLKKYLCEALRQLIVACLKAIRLNCKRINLFLKDAKDMWLWVAYMCNIMWAHVSTTIS